MFMLFVGKAAITEGGGRNGVLAPGTGWPTTIFISNGEPTFPSA